MKGRRSKLDLANNPLRLARKSLNLTIDQLAELAGVNPQALYLNESGCYSNVLPKVMSVLIALSNIDEYELNADYRTWQREKRRAFGDSVAIGEIVITGPAGIVSPVALLRTKLGLSKMRFAKELCLQAALVYRAEQGQSRALPEQVSYALLHAGMNPETVSLMSEWQEEFYFNHGGHSG